MIAAQAVYGRGVQGGPGRERREFVLVADNCAALPVYSMDDSGGAGCGLKRAENSSVLV
jgi:hypothetical protein